MITFCYGTRPEIIKIAPVMWALDRAGVVYRSIHSGQHYDRNMSTGFIEEMKIPQPDENLETRTFPEMVAQFTYSFQGEETPCVVVQGDTNTTLAAGLSAAKLKIPVVHIEAGLRSWDMEMPEELNRILVDNLSSNRFSPTHEAYDNLTAIGLDSFLTGNTIVDALQRFKPTPNGKKHILVTIHREENTTDGTWVNKFLKGLREIHKKHDLDIIFPVHPRTRKLIKEPQNGITLAGPLGYRDFLQAEVDSSCIITDSGGVQEEACILGVPCITMRDSTERPETLTLRANRLASLMSFDAHIDEILTNGFTTWGQPYGENVGEKIAYHLVRLYA